MSENNNAWDEENWWPVMLIMLQRIYDLQLAWLSAINPAKAAELMTLHEAGHTFTPVPKHVAYEDKDE